MQNASSALNFLPCSAAEKAEIDFGKYAHLLSQTLKKSATIVEDDKWSAV